MHNKFYNLLFLVTIWVTLFFVGLLTAVFFIIRLRWFLKLKSRHHKKPSVIFLECNYKGNAGYIYRTTRWVETLRENGHKADSWSILKKEFYLYNFEKDSDKFKFHFSALFLRLAQCIKALQFDIIIIRRELLMYNDYGNLFLERFLLNSHPNLIYDFDDDIGATKREQRKISLFGKLIFETRNKFTWYLRNFKNFIPGSNYLDNLLQTRRYGKPYKKLVVPTLVDYDKIEPRKYNSNLNKITLGWIGGGYNLPYLADIIEPLNELSETFSFKLLVISNKPLIDPRIKFENDFIPWSFENELVHIGLMDLGIMPLPDNNVSRGKCGFKLIQYMGHGVPGIGSSLSINREIIDDNINGYLVNSPEDWKSVLTVALSNKSRLPSMGLAAYQKVQQKYSFNANKEAFLDFIKEVAS